MMSCVVNRSEVLVGEAFGVVRELFLDPGSWGCLKFFADSVIVLFFVAFLKRLGYYCCVVHLGINTIAFVLSLCIFAVTFPSKLKGEKI